MMLPFPVDEPAATALLPPLPQQLPARQCEPHRICEDHIEHCGDKCTLICVSERCRPQPNCFGSSSAEGHCDARGNLAGSLQTSRGSGGASAIRQFTCPQQASARHPPATCVGEARQAAADCPQPAIRRTPRNSRHRPPPHFDNACDLPATWARSAHQRAADARNAAAARAARQPAHQGLHAWANCLCGQLARHVRRLTLAAPIMNRQPHTTRLVINPSAHLTGATSAPTRPRQRRRERTCRAHALRAAGAPCHVSGIRREPPTRCAAARSDVHPGARWQSPRWASAKARARRAGSPAGRSCVCYGGRGA